MIPFPRYLAAPVMTLTILLAALALLWGGFYGFTIFVVLPFALGALADLLFRPKTRWGSAGLGVMAIITASVSFLFLGLEGLLCIAMSWPLTLPAGACGAWAGFEARNFRVQTRGAAMLLLMPLASLSWDLRAPPPRFQVTTSIEIAAPPEQVWKHVLSFSELPEPGEWIFRAGLAYPKRAVIAGTGAGAVRYCEFSTGPFVEPIDVWDAPHLLQFHVTSNPAPLREWSPFARMTPRHLNGYLVSERGEFRLTPLGNHRTRLSGATWYRHGLWPAQYWRIWSDQIIHRIHLRVLNHIRELSEQASR